MPALAKSIYLAFKKPKLQQQVSFLNGFDKARSLLMRLAEKSPHTLFSIYTAAAMKAEKKKMKITAIAPPQAQMLLAPFERLFDDVIEVAETPKYGSREFKYLKEYLDKKGFDVFCDLDYNPLSELAVLSKAKLRIAYFNEGLYPFFNILFRGSADENLLERFTLITRLLSGKIKIEQTMPKPKIEQTRVSDWLKRHGIFKNKSFVISSIALDMESLKGMRVIPPQAWKDESDKLKAALFTSAAYYVGGLDRGFEMSYLMGTPSVLVIPEKEKDPGLPPSPFVKSVIRSSHPSPDLIEGAISGKKQ
ncbi:hypothetical protein GF338_03880 [candidate division WOR-3 bacterium]|nr:hypothetical protein [candidate division WOR-3 bacterium]